MLRVRLGYVAMSLLLENCSPSKTITVKNLEKVTGHEEKIGRLRRITAENLQNCLRLLYHNAAHHIHLFRFTSRLIPLATHPVTHGWDYCADFKREFEKLGSFIRDNHMRVSSHPDHFTLINSPRTEVLEASLRDLEYHLKVFEAMGLKEAQMVMHVGGFYGSRTTSIQRFKDNFRALPPALRQRIVLENDDKSFSAADVLEICTDLGIPMVLDVHHHRCLNRGENVSALLEKVFDTWQHKLPKIHFSSPKSDKNCRAHADDINPDEFYEFLLKAKEVDKDFDVMIEAKNKDAALFKLMKNLKNLNSVNIVDEAEVII